MVAAIHAEQRRKAKEAGERFYETGAPCKHGHISKRYTGTGICAQCAIEATLRTQAKKREHPNRTAARERGETHYSTGTPCKNGHDRRLVSFGQCAECRVERTRNFFRDRPGLEAKWARERRAKDPTGHRASSKRWYEANYDKAREIAKRWIAKNPERRRAMGRAAMNTRRAKKVESGGSFTARDIACLLDKQRGCCAGCGSSGRLEIDHILPVKLGGSSDPHNLQLLCSPCNKSKGSKHPDEWRPKCRQLTVASVFKI